MNPGGFGMGSVSPFVTSQPITVQEEPEQQGGGKNTGGTITGIMTPILGIASMIPGPQQPFVAGAAALSQVAHGVTTNNPSSIAAGAKQVVGAAGIQDMLSGTKDKASTSSNGGELVDPNLQKNPYLEMLMQQPYTSLMPPSPQLPNQYPFKY